MAQIILNLEFDEILRAFTTGAKNEGLRLLLQKGLNAMLERESSEQLGVLRAVKTWVRSWELPPRSWQDLQKDVPFPQK